MAHGAGVEECARMCVRVCDRGGVSLAPWLNCKTNSGSAEEENVPVPQPSRGRDAVESAIAVPRFTHPIIGSAN